MERWLVSRALNRLNIADIKIAWWRATEHIPSGGYAVYLRLRPGVEPTLIQNERQRLAVALNAAEIRVILVAPRLLRIIVRPPMRTGFPAYPQDVTDHFASSSPTVVPLGLDADGHPVSLVLFDAAGGTVSLIGGSPGVGKSCALALVLAGVLDTASHVVWFDPKGGADAGLYASRVQAITDAINASSALAQLVELNHLVQRRAQALGAGLSLRMVAPVVVIVDEWAVLGADGEKRERDRLQEELRRLVATARAVKVAVILATQRPTSATIDVATRSLATTRLCFSVGDAQGSVATLGVTGAELLDAKRDRGRALLDIGHGPEIVQLYEVPQDLAARTRRYSDRKQTTTSIIKWDTVSFREQLR